ENNASECFFIDGPGGTGKTFLYNTILAKVRSHVEIALPVGKIFVFGGDFCQILPVIPHATRADIVSASLSKSSIWKYLKVMKLTSNMRLRQSHNFQDDNHILKQKEFAEFLLKIGDGKYPTNPSIENMITIPSDIVITKGNLTDLIDFVY